MKNTLKKLSVSASLVASLAVGWDTLTLSDSEIQAYFEKSLSIGCRPIVDVCEDDCGANEINLVEAGIPADCIISEQEIIRVPIERAIGNYTELAKKHGYQGHGSDYETMAKKIREGMEKSGKEVRPLKEELVN